MLPVRALGKVALAGFPLPGALLEPRSEALPFLTNCQVCFQDSACAEGKQQSVTLGAPALAGVALAVIVQLDWGQC